MQAVTFQAPGEVRLEERPEPELLERDDAIVRVEVTGVCGFSPLSRAITSQSVSRQTTCAA